MSIDLNIRVVNPTIWNIKGKQLGLLEDAEDDEGNPIVQPKKGVTVHILPTIGQQQHINLRITDETIAASFETFFEDAVVENKPAQSNKSETAWKWQGIEVIDMETVNTPLVVWL